MELNYTVTQELTCQPNVMAVATELGPESARAIRAYRGGTKLTVCVLAMTDLRTCIAQAKTLIYPTEAALSLVTVAARQGDASWATMLATKVPALFIPLPGSPYSSMRIRLTLALLSGVSNSMIISAVNPI